jgi:hypothetical protein
MYIERVKRHKTFNKNFAAKVKEKTMPKKSFMFFCLGLFMTVYGIPAVSAQSNTDWSRCEGTTGKISSSLQQSLDRLGQQTGVKPQIRWGYRTADDRARIVARSYSDTNLYRETATGSIVRRSDGTVMVAPPGASPHERGQAVDLWNGGSYTAEQLSAAGLQNDPGLDEPWHIIEQ